MSRRIWPASSGSSSAPMPGRRRPHGIPISPPCAGHDRSPRRARRRSHRPRHAVARPAGFEDHGRASRRAAPRALDPRRPRPRRRAAGDYELIALPLALAGLDARRCAPFSGTCHHEPHSRRHRSPRPRRPARSAARAFVVLGRRHLEATRSAPCPRRRRRARRGHRGRVGPGFIRSWNTHGWIDRRPDRRQRSRAHRIFRRRPGEVIVADSTSVNLFKLMARRCACVPAAASSCRRPRTSRPIFMSRRD